MLIASDLLERLPSLTISKTPRTGLGVFALSNIAKDCLVFVFEGDELMAWDIEQDKLEHCLQLDFDKYIVPEVGSFGWYLNHSCDPNCYVKGKNQIVSIRDVKANEEITIDYSFNVGWKDFKMPCQCNSPNCRGMIRDYFSLPEELRKSNRKYASEFLLRKAH